MDKAYPYLAWNKNNWITLSQSFDYTTTYVVIAIQSYFQKLLIPFTKI